MPFKMHKMIFFQKKKIIKKICVPTLPKIFRPVTRNTLIFLLGLKNNFEHKIVIFFIHLSKMFLVLKRTISLCTQKIYKKIT